MQAPGGPEEDTSGGFTKGGWLVPYFDEALGNEMTKQMTPPIDLLLGRKTYEIFKSYWPHQNSDTASVINNATKYVVSRKQLELDWKTSIQLGKDVAADVRKLKKEDGPILQVHGSGNLIQTLLKNDLVDELWLKIFPVTLGKGKRLFENGTIPAGFSLIESKTSPSGVIIASFKRSGDVKLGSF
jgi:dihydrofolate reductase